MKRLGNLEQVESNYARVIHDGFEFRNICLQSFRYHLKYNEIDIVSKNKVSDKINQQILFDISLF